MHIYFEVQSTCDIHSYISFTKDTEIEAFSIAYIECKGQTRACSSRIRRSFILKIDEA